MHQIHDTLPSGFSFADPLQAEEFTATGFVNGAAKVVLVRATDIPDVVDVAVRLRPPRSWFDIISPLPLRERCPLTRAQERSARDWYVAEYNKGWTESRRGRSASFGSGMTTHAYDDGYLDYAAGRAKWHLTYCPDHDVCGEG